MCNYKRLKRTALLKLPKRRWDETSQYNSLMVTKAGTKHESDYAHLLVVGCNYADPIEIVSTSSDVLHINNPYNLQLNMDMFYPSGVIRYFLSSGVFECGSSLSSLFITAKHEKNNDTTAKII